ncbi:uncharacterized protein LOC110819267 isoform X2 [Carica papaya]|uniref:uncharacterized protein LOC110819267 isoform X2 n=1 Tax=Carica papaya TaxID=3649 RepID=UPI000B8CBD21|nr:uncharacterized protein LOC110819267 isoform X2 [Carica papaya]XP_021904087.1 uncharacterized protein LOC110819267 isoform X2 [Carica papaya]
MLISRLSKIGFRIVKELPRGTCTSLNRGALIQRKCGQYLQPQNGLWGAEKVFQIAACQRHRYFSTTPSNNGLTQEGNQEKEMISVTFVDKEGEEKNIKVPVGTSMLEAAHENDIELEGACEGSLACSTCHVIVMDVEYYNKLDDPTDEENDMLDLAFGLTETSRLGCQIVARPELDGIRLAIPAATRNFAVDGYVPKPH